MTRGGKCAGSALRAHNARAATFGSLGLGSGGSAAGATCLTSGAVEGAVGLEIGGGSAPLSSAGTGGLVSSGGACGPTFSGGVGRLCCATACPQHASVIAISKQQIRRRSFIGLRISRGRDLAGSPTRTAACGDWQAEARARTRILWKAQRRGALTGPTPFSRF